MWSVCVALWPLLGIMFSGAQAACECGYTVNAANTTDYALFTNVLETDFTRLAEDALDWDKRNSTGWALQVYSRTKEESRNGGYFGLNVTAANVVLNPLEDPKAQSGRGKLGRDAGMQLWVRGEVLNDMISTGQVATLRDDILHGSFRVGVKMTPVPGTCGAFFWYHNDSQEIDFEYLSYQQAPNSTDDRTYHPLNLVIQTPQSAAAGYNAAGTPNFAVVPLPFDPAGDFHEFRFDWTPSKVTYYADGEQIATMTYEIPNTPGRVFLNHWSNGNPGWSRGPPTQDAVMTVSYVKAYFNTSSPSDRSGYEKACTDKYGWQSARWTDHTCPIPEQQGAFFTDAGGQPPSKPGQQPDGPADGPANSPTTSAASPGSGDATRSDVSGFLLGGLLVACGTLLGFASL